MILRIKMVKDLCNCAGLYQGVAQKNSNLKYQIAEQIPVLFHSYSAHLFPKDIGKKFNKEDIGVFQENKEKCTSSSTRINASWQE